MTIEVDPCRHFASQFTTWHQNQCLQHQKHGSAFFLWNQPHEQLIKLKSKRTSWQRDHWILPRRFRTANFLPFNCRCFRNPIHIHLTPLIVFNKPKLITIDSSAFFLKHFFSNATDKQDEITSEKERPKVAQRFFSYKFFPILLFMIKDLLNIGEIFQNIYRCHQISTH